MPSLFTRFPSPSGGNASVRLLFSLRTGACPWPITEGTVRITSMVLLGCLCLNSFESQSTRAAEPATANGQSTGGEESPVDFNSQIRPILVANCTSCHGGVKQAGDVSFIYPEQVLPPDGWIVEPGDPEASILIERITTDDADIRMPPPDEHPDPLSPEDIELLRRWIAEGAQWQNMWALTPLVPDSTPAVSKPANFGESKWGTQSLDSIVLANLQAKDLTPSEEAPAEQWLRRASFDLVGMPPSEEQLTEFLSKLESVSSPSEKEAVYAAEVDTILAKSHFGERWASVWMDLARYADSMGFEKDPHRDMWPYRDWLIQAFNADMPYDEFTIKQLAGDLLEDATAGDWIATAFHRNTQTNTEGGTDDEEFRIAALIDRVNTTWTVWQASTFGCVQCHSHPYDPIEHNEYYASLAMFNDTMDVDLQDEYPTIRVPSDPSQMEQAISVQRRAEELRHQRNAVGWNVAHTANWQSLPPASFKTTDGKLKQVDNQIVTDGGTFPPGTKYIVELDLEDLQTQLGEQPLSAMKLDILPLSDDPAQWPEQGSVLSELTAEWIDAEGNATPVAWAGVIADAITGSTDPDDVLRGNASGAGEYPKLTGPRQTVFVMRGPSSWESLIEKSIKTLRLTMRQSHSTTGNLATPIRRLEWFATTDEEANQLLESDQWKQLTDSLAQARKDVSQVKGPKLPIVFNRPAEAARETRVFVRGNWMERGEKVDPAIPVAFTQGTSVSPSDVNSRLELAQWLVSNDNPLTPRVWANRVWAQLFGIGLVETQEDFGSSGLQPTHPQLLDHLALRLRDEHRWHLKPFLRELVLSSTYRQTHHVSQELQQADPRNQWLARGPRTRLTAEMVRDQALAVSGLLTEQIGGPSVMPPQPDGVWQTVYSGASWKTATGPERYRRALYTYWRRTSPYPSFLTFDSPTRDLCAPRRIATNTPLQALVTLNDPVYAECGKALVEQTATAETQGTSTPIESQIARMFLLVTQSQPTEWELHELKALYDDLDETSGVPQDDGKLNVDQNALAIVASTILNLDKALTK